MWGVKDGRRGDEHQAPDDAIAGVLRAHAGRLARLVDPAAPAVHAVAPVVRGDRRRARADVNVRWWLETLLAFFLAMGVAAHALDELHGRPLRTRIPDGVLWGSRSLGWRARSRSGSTARSRSRRGSGRSSSSGAFLVLAYNLELFGGAFHSDLWFALAWGAFPVLTAYFAQTGDAERAAVLAGRGRVRALSAAQRVLSTPVRRLRRPSSPCTGTIALDDGTASRSTPARCAHAPEARAPAAVVSRCRCSRRR